MRFSSAQELEIASEEVNNEIFDEDHAGDVIALAGIAQNGGRTPAQAIVILLGALVLLAEENTADAQVAIAGSLAAAKALNDATLHTIVEATTSQLVADLATQGPVAELLSALGFASGGVVSE